MLKKAQPVLTMIALNIGGRIFLLSLILIAATATPAQTAAAFQPSEATRSAVEQAIGRTFEMVRSHDYRAAYLMLPSEARRNTTLQNFITDLRESESRYAANRIEIKEIQVADNFAIAHTTMYGRTFYPRNAEGKIVIQQLLLLEDGAWRIATGYKAFYKMFKKQQPELAKKYRIRAARVYMRDGNGWIDVTPQASR